MYTYMYMYIHTCTYTYIHVFVCIYIYIHICIYIYINIHIDIYTYVCRCIVLMFICNSSFILVSRGISHPRSYDRPRGEDVGRWVDDLPVMGGCEIENYRKLCPIMAILNWLAYFCVARIPWVSVYSFTANCGYEWISAPVAMLVCVFFGQSGIPW